MKHIKLFENQTDYHSFKSSDNFILPNVSLVKEDNSVLYEPIPGEEIIEYHFEIPLDEQYALDAGYMSECIGGVLQGDYSELYDKLTTYAKKHGVYNGSAWAVGERFSGVPLTNPKITINHLNATDIYVYDEKIGMNYIEIGTDGGTTFDCDSTAVLYRTLIDIVIPKN